MQRYFGNTELSFAPPAKPVAVDTPEVHAAARPRVQVYWFHPDHLGTGTLITGPGGHPEQFFLNFPYGETFIEQGGYTYDNPYKFNGKELDEETRLYYYGARYYEPKISLWLSVDPKIEYNKNQSPYVYTSSNPIVLLDPDGKDDFYFDFFWGTVTYIKNDKPNRYFITHHKFHFEKINNHSKWSVGSEQFDEQISINDYRLNGVRVNGKDVIQYILHANGSEEKYREVYFSLKSDLRPLAEKFCLGTAAVLSSGVALENIGISETLWGNLRRLYDAWSNSNAFIDILNENDNNKRALKIMSFTLFYGYNTLSTTILNLKEISKFFGPEKEMIQFYFDLFFSGIHQISNIEIEKTSN